VGYGPKVWLNPFLGLYYPNQGEKVNRSDACKNLKKSHPIQPSTPDTKRKNCTQKAGTTRWE
jgi:hypothetical protein